MSFPFYRNSANHNKSRDEIRQERYSMVAPNQHATQDYDVTVVEERSSSRFRIPFLMRKRKSMVTLRSTGTASVYEDRARPCKTVSQLADETATRLARSSFGREHLELPSVNLSSVSLGLGSNHATPQKKRVDGRRSGFSSTTSLSASTELRSSRNTSEKSKSSIFFRVSSRPLSSRNSSADLKSTTFDRSPDRRSPTHLRPKITLPTSPVKEYIEDDLFLAPRLAPTPPTLTVNMQKASARNLEGASSTTLSPYATRSGGKPSTPATSTHSILTQRYPPSSQIAFASPHSSTDLDLTPQKQWHKSPSPVFLSSQAHRPPTDAGRIHEQSGLRIGRERLTLSVANALEEGLGININDETDEDSIYGQSTEDHSADVQSDGTPSKTTETSMPVASLSRERNWPESDAAAALEAQSPLSLLISANDPNQLPATPLKHGSAKISQEAPQAFHKVSPRPIDSDRDPFGTKARGFFTTFLGDTSASDDAIRATTAHSNVEDMKRLLDFQCSRFDRVAKHLLEIISRHEAQKVQYESQLTALKKDAVRREREIKRLESLLDSGCSCGFRHATDPFHVAPLRIALSSTASLEEILLGNGAGPTSKSGDNELRLSVDASPLTTPLKEKRMAMTLRRSKTMPQLHVGEVGPFAPSSPSPIVPSPDVSGLSLQFPIPKPLSVQSIASTILSSAPASSLSVPPLTSSTTVDSDISVALPTPAPLAHPATKVRQGEFFRFSNQHYTASKTTSLSDMDIHAADSYARNLNSDLGLSIGKIINP